MRYTILRLLVELCATILIYWLVAVNLGYQFIFNYGTLFAYKPLGNGSFGLYGVVSVHPPFLDLYSVPALALFGFFLLLEAGIHWKRTRSSRLASATSETAVLLPERSNSWPPAPKS